MRKVLTIAVAVTMVLVFVGTVHAADDSWRIKLTCDNGAGMGPISSHLGVFPGMNDYAPADAQDHEAAYGADMGQSTIWGVADIGDGKTYDRDIKAGDLALPKVWNLRVAALPSSLYTAIRLQFATISAPVLPPATVSGNPVWYELEMINNRGVAGAPANGTIWDVSAITTGAGYVVTPNFPMLKLSVGNHAAMLAEGYVLSFTQDVVPEPSGLLALGTGLSGLVGFMIRRRRA